MQTHEDLIGKVYRNGDDGVIRYRVTGFDGEFPSIVHTENLTTGATGCALADMVRFNLLD